MAGKKPLPQHGVPPFTLPSGSASTTIAGRLSRLATQTVGDPGPDAGKAHSRLARG